MTEVHVSLKCKKCKQYKTPYTEEGMNEMQLHMKKCDGDLHIIPKLPILKLDKPKTD